MTRCWIPEIFEQYKLDIGMYDVQSKGILPRSVNQSNVCLYLQKISTVFFEIKNVFFLDAKDELERILKPVKIDINEKNISQKIRYRFPRHGTIGQQENVFLFDLETSNSQEFATVDAARLNNLNRLQDMWDRDSTSDEIVSDRENSIVFDKSSGNPIIDLPKCISEKYEGDKRKYIDIDGYEVASPCRILFLASNGNDFDSWVVFNSLDKETTESKKIRTASGLVTLSFRCALI